MMSDDILWELEIKHYMENQKRESLEEGEEKAKEQNADGDYADNSVSWRFVCVCNPRFTKDCIAEGKRETPGRREIPNEGGKRGDQLHSVHNSISLILRVRAP